MPKWDIAYCVVLREYMECICYLCLFVGECEWILSAFKTLVLLPWGYQEKGGNDGGSGIRVLWVEGTSGAAAFTVCRDFQLFGDQQA